MSAAELQHNMRHVTHRSPALFALQGASGAGTGTAPAAATASLQATRQREEEGNNKGGLSGGAVSGSWPRVSMCMVCTWVGVHALSVCMRALVLMCSCVHRAGTQRLRE